MREWGFLYFAFLPKCDSVFSCACLRFLNIVLSQLQDALLCFLSKCLSQRFKCYLSLSLTPQAESLSPVLVRRQGRALFLHSIDDKK